MTFGLIVGLLLTCPVGDPGTTQEVTRFSDPAIVESSGLVARDRELITTNDSGDGGQLFVVDQRTGKTRSTVDWASDPQDVEALAPADRGEVWVGDIGDNFSSRTSVEVTRVSLPGPPRTRTFEVRYPAGPADAEALLSHPETGQLFVVTKSVFGGEVLALPSRLRASRPNRATSLGSVAGLVTDGAFFPDGRHFILRNYSRAFVYAYPTLDLIAEFALPDQPQGEGLAVAGPSCILLSSEGIRASVLSVTLSAEVQEAMQPEPPAAAPSVEAEPPRSDTQPGWWFAAVVGLGLVVLTGLGRWWHSRTSGRQTG